MSSGSMILEHHMRNFKYNCIRGLGLRENDLVIVAYPYRPRGNVCKLTLSPKFSI